MNNKIKDVPKLRFPGFEEEWKIDNIGAHVDIISGVPIKGEDISQNPSGTPILRGVNITEGYIRHSRDIDRFYMKSIEAVDKFIVQEGDLVIPMDGSKVGRNYAIVSKSEENAVLIQRVARLRSKSMSCLPFIYQHISSAEFQKYVDEVNTSSGIPHISLKQLQQFKVAFPTLLEQQKIAAFLTAVDDKIQQLNKKKALLEQYKKGVMHQIFNREIRFKDENGECHPDWEQKQLGNIATFSKGKGISKSDITPDGDLDCILYGELYTYYSEKIDSVRSKTNLKATTCVLSDANDVIVPASGESRFDIATASCVLKSGVALGGDLNIIKSTVNGIYLAYYLNHKKKFEIAALAQGISVVHLYSSQLRTLNVEIPSNLEQNKIVNFLSALDDKIKHVDQQIERTKQYKKGLLQQMFV